ncbi:hypothetical protein Emin_0961 [Elusimicrobium minutum Pei191]|uniref:Uncharacterized protein n=1 Tax=Elusimicrobium minutum (strain Pei191) TaxID=445932 RepID=B2KDB8_ELUMP|nr:Lar family restriction alleviation protein [Elusimicrobium minutum]ACC98514.1 hypothetical protein Emin_0961 [Elusimicrobium minutum Pei191]
MAMSKEEQAELKAAKEAANAAQTGSRGGGMKEKICHDENVCTGMCIRPQCNCRLKDKNLKPCPFCGERAVIKRTDRYPRRGEFEGQRIDGYSVVCGNMNCIIFNADDKYKYTKQEAIKAWNRRAK